MHPSESHAVDTAEPPSPTAAEGRVLSLVCRGQTNREIAAALVLSVRTVESHIASLLAKTGCRNRTQLLIWTLTAR
ncbi:MULTISPECIES: response regulator transcription factor [Aphanothece]|uniref:response regulator transcription factor n=1 Tax=Aphanothece TaxID=1121 RepID=UPI0039852531